MKIDSLTRPNNWLCAIFIFDCAVMPVIKILGLSVKISYGIAFVSILLMFINSTYIKRVSYGGASTIVKSLIAYIGLLCFGEFWSIVFYGVPLQTGFFRIVIGCLLMIGSLTYGYRCNAQIGSIAYYCFVANVVVNCILALLGRAAPSFMLKLYSLSVDTFMDGYYRNGGIIGNPNSSLLVTNIVLLLVVVLYKYDKIKLSNIKLASLYLLSVAADIIVSSRGELLHSTIILAYLTYLIIKKNNSFLKFFKKAVLIVFIIFFVVGLFWGTLVASYPNIQTSIDRMDSITDVFDSSSEGEDVNTIKRPFLRANVFWQRFRHSPIWGTGIDGGGNISDFEKGTTGYHNDFFMILGATGIAGLLLWIAIIRKAVKKVGICMLFPFVVTAISNTFVRSYFGTMLYFFIIGYVMCIRDKEEKREFEDNKVKTTSSRLVIENSR